ncbi:hypothetical protein chiPu_0017570 [Chiloscyllium punctatum]|uniref:Uncharacterized protein n=1 Tax=Chiloscyllium punctatum TaxID=137246 RepID=A0A401RH70_CHIPU|nr:hypothetical protein [Chiloscyllium punctatum]
MSPSCGWLCKPNDHRDKDKPKPNWDCTEASLREPLALCSKGERERQGAEGGRAGAGEGRCEKQQQQQLREKLQACTGNRQGEAEREEALVPPGSL